jgi:curved DNA-binding protein CbpA
MSEDFDPYWILQVADEAEDEVIQAAYRRLSRMYHPDRNPSPEAERRMQRINAAYEIVGDPRRRRQFDELRRGLRHDLPRRTPDAALPALLIVETIVRLVAPSNGSRAVARFELVNRGGGLLAGALRASPEWLRVSPTAFAANRLSVEVRAEPGSGATDTPRRGRVDVDTNGGRGAVDVLLLSVPPTRRP